MEPVAEDKTHATRPRRCIILGAHGPHILLQNLFPSVTWPGYVSGFMDAAVFTTKGHKLRKLADDSAVQVEICKPVRSLASPNAREVPAANKSNFGRRYVPTLAHPRCACC